MLGYLLSGRAVFEEARRERESKKKRGGEKSREQSRHRERRAAGRSCVSRRGRVRACACVRYGRERGTVIGATYGRGFFEQKYDGSAQFSHTKATLENRHLCVSLPVATQPVRPRRPRATPTPSQKYPLRRSCTPPLAFFLRHRPLLLFFIHSLSLTFSVCF